MRLSHHHPHRHEPHGHHFAPRGRGHGFGHGRWGDPEDGGMCMEDENGAYTCIIVPSHKDLASSLLKGARRMLGFSDKALGNAEKKLPKKDDESDKK